MAAPRGFLFLLLLAAAALVLLSDSCVAAAANHTRSNYTLISPEVDRALAQVPPAVWDTFAGIGIVVGTIFAFVGSRMLRTSAFFFGAFVGGTAGAAIVGLIDFQASSDAFLSVIVIGALLVGLIVAKLVSIARFAAVIAVGVICAGLFNQYVLSHFAPELEPWTLYVVMAVFVVVVALVAWKFLTFALIFASAILGGFAVLMSVARLVRGPISLVGMWADPAFLQACTEMDCWGPFIAGGAVCLLGLVYQLRKFAGCGKRKRPPPPPPPPPLVPAGGYAPERTAKEEELDRKLAEVDFKLKQLEDRQEIHDKMLLLEEKQRLADELRALPPSPPMVLAPRRPEDDDEMLPQAFVPESASTQHQQPSWFAAWFTAKKEAEKQEEQEDEEEAAATGREGRSVAANPLFNGPPPALPPNKPRTGGGGAAVVANAEDDANEEATSNKFAGKWAAVEKRYSVKNMTSEEDKRRRRNSSNATDSSEIDPGMVEAEIRPVRDLFSDALETANYALVKFLELLVFGLVLVGRCVRHTYDAVEDARVEQRRVAATRSAFNSGGVRQGLSG